MGKATEVKNAISTVFPDINGKTATKIIDAYLDKDWKEFVEITRRLSTWVKTEFSEIINTFAFLSEPMKTLIRRARDYLMQIKRPRDNLEEQVRFALKPYSEMIQRFCMIP